jgi:hypothetical protein
MGLRYNFTLFRGGKVFPGVKVLAVGAEFACIWRSYETERRSRSDCICDVNMALARF